MTNLSYGIHVKWIREFMGDMKQRIGMRIPGESFENMVFRWAEVVLSQFARDQIPENMIS